ncbi:MAG: DUF6057 family protein [bacterium]
MKYLKFFSTVFLFAFSFFWFFYPGEYVLIANQDNNLFITSLGYLTSYLDRPGGILEYISVFLNQFFRFRFIGAIIISGIVIIGYYAVFYLCRKISDNKYCYLPGIITAIWFIGMHNYYSHQLYHSLGYIVAIIALLFIPEGKKARIMFLLFCIPVLYYIIGGYLWVFCFFILVESYSREVKFHADFTAFLVVYPLLIIIIAAKFVFLYPVKELFIHPFQYETNLFHIIFVSWIIFLPLIIKKIFWLKHTKLPKGIMQFSLLLTGAFLIIIFSYNKRAVDFFRIEKLVIQEDWDELLGFMKQKPSTSLIGNFYTNIALANRGLLTSDLFAYPQPFGRQGLFLGWLMRDDILEESSDFFWTINYVNEAHHFAFESFIVNGFTRRNILRLIQTELIRGNYKVAEKYINVLDKTLFDKGKAGHYRKFLNNPDIIKNDAELGPRMNISFSSDFFLQPDLEDNLGLLLENEPFNRPAYDYLLALYLIEKRVDKITEYLPGYLDLTDGNIPPLLEESLVYHRFIHGNIILDTIKISQRTNLRFQNFIRINDQFTDPAKAARALYPSYKNTLWYHINFNLVTEN